jgi:hypothetical protein
LLSTLFGGGIQQNGRIHSARNKKGLTRLIDHSNFGHEFAQLITQIY